MWFLSNIAYHWIPSILLAPEPSIFLQPLRHIKVNRSDFCKRIVYLEILGTIRTRNSVIFPEQTKTTRKHQS